MANWMNILIIGAVIIIGIFFILPALSGMNKEGMPGGISGGVSTFPEGDIGQGGILSERLPEGQSIFYLPSNTAGVNLQAESSEQLPSFASGSAGEAWMRRGIGSRTSSVPSKATSTVGTGLLATMKTMIQTSGGGKGTNAGTSKGSTAGSNVSAWTSGGIRAGGSSSSSSSGSSSGSSNVSRWSSGGIRSGGKK